MAKSKKLTLTIGIPAYNEAGNIRFLLKSIMRQQGLRARLEKILIVSDGSTDETVALAKKSKSKRVVVIEHRKRQGVAQAQNTIIAHTTSDVLVMLNADIFIADRQFIAKLIEPIIHDYADLVGGNMLPLKPVSLVERLLYVGMVFKQPIFRKLNKGQNIYTCAGPARAYTKRFYQDFRFTESIAEDAYSYLYCISHNYMYRFAPKAKAYFKLPSTFHDHFGQSRRFFQSGCILKRYFASDLVAASYAIPKSLSIRAAWRSFLQHPDLFIGYCLLVLWSKLYFAKCGSEQPTWQVAESSKLLSKAS